MNTRSFITLLGGMLFLSGELQLPSMDAWLAILVGAFLWPFLSYVLKNFALQRVDAWIVATLFTTLPLFVTLY